MMEGFRIGTDKSLLQVDRIHRFLSEDAYWSQGIPRKVVERAIEGSLCFGLYDSGGVQVGFARVVTDSATFAWICDVYVEKELRGRGLSKWLMKEVMEDSRLQGLRRVCLATRDAHGLYKQFGFEATKAPTNFMEVKDNDIYLRSISPSP